MLAPMQCGWFSILMCIMPLVPKRWRCVPSDPDPNPSPCNLLLDTPELSNGIGLRMKFTNFSTSNRFLIGYLKISFDVAINFQIYSISLPSTGKRQPFSAPLHPLYCLPLPGTSAKFASEKQNATIAINQIRRLGNI
jgi:hypothetical protein